MVHPSSCKVGKTDGTRNLPSLGSGSARAPLGYNLQFPTITLHQPPYKRTHYVADLTAAFSRMPVNPSSGADARAKRRYKIERAAQTPNPTPLYFRLDAKE